MGSILRQIPTFVALALACWVQLRLAGWLIDWPPVRRRERDEGRHQALVEQALPEGRVRLDPADRGRERSQVGLRATAGGEGAAGR